MLEVRIHVRGGELFGIPATLNPKPEGFLARFLRNPFIIRVPFFLIFSFNKGTLNQKGQKGTTQQPSWAYSGSGLWGSGLRPEVACFFGPKWYKELPECLDQRRAGRRYSTSISRRLQVYR